MCGIFYLSLRGGSDEAEKAAVKHGDLVRHRGPDAGSRLLLDCNADASRKHLFCFHRLAIVATDGIRGMQPLERDGNVLVCNGEIYNHRKFLGAEDVVDVAAILEVLKSCSADSSGDDDDSAVGDAVGAIDGDFAFVALIGDGSVVVAGRDSAGVKPLFMAIGEGDAIVGFASEAKALLGAPGVLDVRVFPPGHVCVDGRLVRYRYLLPDEARRAFLVRSLLEVSERSISRHMSFKPPECPPPELLVRSLLEAAVRKRVAHSERPVAILCSGGIDSAAVLAVAVRQATAASLPLPRVFTMRYGVGSSEDAFYAAMLCHRLGCRHEVDEFGPEDLGDATIEAVVRACETCDPNTIRAALPMFLLARHIAATTDVKVILSGEGADELFGGYGYFRLAPSAEDASAECGRLLSNLHMFDLLRADRCFAAHGLEVRVPFLDSDLVHAVSDTEVVPPSERTRGEKQLLRDAVKDLGELADLRILSRPKEKFSDGTGFSYVPDLLRRLASDRRNGPGDDGTLPCRLAAERRAYARMFEAAYGSPAGRWVVEREVPSWVEPAAKEASKYAAGCEVGRR